MKLLRFLFSRTFVANLILALILSGVIIGGIAYFLNAYTRHGEYIEVPDLKELALVEVEQVLTPHQLEYEVIDSSEYDPSFPRGAVINQYPEAGHAVKAGRSIRLTLNPLQPRKITVPNLIEKTKRRAIYDLESKGFVVGELSYVPYIGKDVVVDIKIDGRSLERNEEFQKGTVIDLVLGEGLGNTFIKVPYLRFLNAQEAEAKLKSASLNIGSLIYDEEVEDSTLALVYRQSPAPSLEPQIKPGMEIDLWLTSDYTKIPNDSLKFQNVASSDSLAVDSLPNE